MKCIIKRSIIIALIATVMVCHSWVEEASARDTGRRRHSPPPEAYTACEGKSAGDSAEFESPHGDTVTGTCVEEDDRLVLRPDHPPGGKGRRDTDD